MKRRTKPVSLQPAEGLGEYHDFTKPEVLARYRAALAASTLKDGTLPEGITETWETVNGVRLARLTVQGANHKDLIFHIHGGAWNGGVPCTGQRAFVELIHEAKVDLVSVEYGLAPECPFPKGLLDCAAAYQGILDQGYEPERIQFMGESAGGNLCLALGLYCKDHGIPLPGGMMLLSPSTLDYNFQTMEALLQEHPEDLKLSEDIETHRMYIRDADPKNPYVAPIYGDFSGFPPVLIQFGGSEFLYRDGVELTYKLMQAGVDVQSHCWEYMPHVFTLMLDLLPEAEQGKRELLAYLTRVYQL